MPSAIKVENLSKAYRLGLIGTGTLGSDINRWLALARGREDPFLKIGETNDRTVRGKSDVVWSLRDISFEIQQGDAVGIIGRNGAGKSTLLKILSRVTSPTTGRITGNGRVASLLEVGTGFHPELTGKDNIYLNGAILGMRKKEIKRKYDEIVDFAGVERYIDTPVKRYSSGMYVRLAFAVAAYLESEILIVDEVLAVGDAEFQKKCLGKMKEVSKGEGRTVLFVSHNMNSISRLCSSVILLKNGHLKNIGNSVAVINSYLGEGVQNQSWQEWAENQAPGNEIVKLLEVKAENDNGNVAETYDIRKPVKLSMRYKVLQDNCKLTHAFVFHNEEGIRLFDSHDINSPWKSNTVRKKGYYLAELSVPGNFLAEGKIKITPAIITSAPFEIHVLIEDALAFMIADTGSEESARGEYLGNYLGVIRPLLNWKSNFNPE